MKKYIILFALSFTISVFAQTELVFIYFKDKPNKAAFFSNPQSELSQKSIDRRANLGIALNDQDAPVEQTYINQLQSLSYNTQDVSKWLNGVAVTVNQTQINELSQLSFVDRIESFVKNPNAKQTSKKSEKFPEFSAKKSQLTNFDYGVSLQQINQIKVREMHVAGYTGSGITIAVIDTGFPTVNTGTAFKRLRDNGQIKGGYDFVNKSTNIYNPNLNNHGTICLGTIGGYIDNQFVGSAPDANFYLYVSEDANEEIPQEEIYWIQAAEEADRNGVDIITTSLGYTTFDDPRYDYTYEDMNGKTSFIARGSQIATEKGILLTAAAGNEGNKTWHFISTPADNAKVFTIGAVDYQGNSSSFSSFGPNADEVIKPDASARGSNTYTVYDNQTTSASGTSLANPLAAGGIACLLQALDHNIPRDEIRNKLRQNASLYPSYTNQKGYGILDIYKTLGSYLTINDIKKSEIKLYPNPVKDILTIKTDKSIQKIELYNYLGQIIKTEIGDQLNLSQLPKGNYFVKIKMDGNDYIEKIIKE